MLFAPFSMKAVVALRKYVSKVERRSPAWHLAAPIDDDAAATTATAAAGSDVAQPHAAWSVAWVRTHTMGLGLGVGCYPPVASKWIARVLQIVNADATPSSPPRRKLFGFPSLAQLSNKAALSRAIAAQLLLSDVDSSDSAECVPSYYPRSWVLPRDSAQLTRYLKGRDDDGSASSNAARPYILKPSSATQGDGIRLLSGDELLACGLGARLLPRELVKADATAKFRAKRGSLVDSLLSSSSSDGGVESVRERSDAESWVVQRYLERPLLTPLPFRRDDEGGDALYFAGISGEATLALHKFDLRLYVLVVAGADFAGASPRVGGGGTGRKAGDLRAFLFVDGLVRVCAQAYSDLDLNAIAAAAAVAAAAEKVGARDDEKVSEPERYGFDLVDPTTRSSPPPVASNVQSEEEALMCAHLTNSHLNARSPLWDASRCKLTLRNFLPLLAAGMVDEGEGERGARRADNATVRGFDIEALQRELCSLVGRTVSAIEPAWRAQRGGGWGDESVAPPLLAVAMPPPPPPPSMTMATAPRDGADAMLPPLPPMGLPPPMPPLMGSGGNGAASAEEAGRGGDDGVEERGAVSFYVMGFDVMLVKPPSSAPSHDAGPVPVLLEINSKPKLSPAKVRTPLPPCACAYARPVLSHTHTLLLRAGRIASDEGHARGAHSQGTQRRNGVEDRRRGRRRRCRARDGRCLHAVLLGNPS